MEMSKTAQFTALMLENANEKERPYLLCFTFICNLAFASLDCAVYQGQFTSSSESEINFLNADKIFFVP